MNDKNLEEFYFEHDDRRGIIWFDDNQQAWNVEYKGKNIGTIPFSEMPEIIYGMPENWLIEKAVAMVS